jgi:hypothetical protein
MADLINPYANPYLPSFVNQRPRMNDSKPIPQMNLATPSYTQIRSVNGFSGARAHAEGSLAPGASDILAESDPNIPRVYIVAKDSSGQTIVEGYRLIHEDEPKPITMDDLNAKMSELLDRMNKLEEKSNEPNVKSGSGYSEQNRATGTSVARNQQNGRGGPQSQAGATANTANDAR